MVGQFGYSFLLRYFTQGSSEASASLDSGVRLFGVAVRCTQLAGAVATERGDAGPGKRLPDVGFEKPLLLRTRWSFGSNMPVPASGAGPLTVAGSSLGSQVDGDPKLAP
jgi:hypothetical protein